VRAHWLQFSLNVTLVLQARAEEGTGPHDGSGVGMLRGLSGLACHTQEGGLWGKKQVVGPGMEGQAAEGDGEGATGAGQGSCSLFPWQKGADGI
jgi:hypothetical protein